MKVFLLPLILLMATSSAVAAERDPILDAMNDELKRSVTELKIDKHDKPYYVSYMISDDTSLEIAAAFGAITKDELSRGRNAFVDVHVGTYQLDSGHVSRGLFGLAGGVPGSVKEISLDDNYDAIRHELWLQTDSSYKNAIQHLEKKKSDLGEKNVKERPDDWSKESAIVRVEPRCKLSVDRVLWADKMKGWSAIFKSYPKIRTSKVTLDAALLNKYFVNNEGSEIRVPDGRCMLSASATAESSDGFAISDSVVFGSFDIDHMPADALVQEKIKALAEKLTQVIVAKELDTYDGPIMLEGEAAAEFFDKILSPSIIVKRPFDGDPIKNTEDANQSRIGRRILPTYVNVEDIPDLKDEKGALLPAGYDVDNEGVPGQKVVVVEKGILKRLLSTRLPTLKNKSSNGHAPGNGGEPIVTNLVVNSERTLDMAALKAKLMALGKDEGLDYVLIVRKFSAPPQMNGRDFSFENISALLSGVRNRSALPYAVEVVKVNLSDGHEELLRGGQFTTANIRMLRDIAATGDDKHRYQLTDGQTVTTPSLIVTDVELQKIHADADKPPKLEHPYFEKH
jgi:TldD protein